MKFGLGFINWLDAFQSPVNLKIPMISPVWFICNIPPVLVALFQLDDISVLIVPGIWFHPVPWVSVTIFWSKSLSAAFSLVDRLVSFNSSNDSIKT